MFKGTGLTAIYLDQDPHAALKIKMVNLYRSYLQKDYARSQGKDDETVTTARRSRRIGIKLQTWKNISPPSDFNIAPA